MTREEAIKADRLYCKDCKHYDNDGEPCDTCVLGDLTLTHRPNWADGFTQHGGQGGTGMTQFEAWKAGLTLEQFALTKMTAGCCDLCPIFPREGCYGKEFTQRKCYQAIKEWGDKNAE